MIARKLSQKWKSLLLTIFSVGSPQAKEFRKALLDQQRIGRGHNEIIAGSASADFLGAAKKGRRTFPPCVPASTRMNRLGLMYAWIGRDEDRS
jgi:hypothetical protein